MFSKQKTYLALYERKDSTGFHIDFTTRIMSKPPKLQDFIFRTGFTGRVIILEVKEIPIGRLSYDSRVLRWS